MDFSYRSLGYFLMPCCTVELCCIALRAHRTFNAGVLQIQSQRGDASGLLSVEAETPRTSLPNPFVAQVQRVVFF